MADGRAVDKRDEEGRQRMAKELEDVGDNLPDHFHGVEGSDVGNVERDDAEATNPLQRDENVVRKEQAAESDTVELHDDEATH